MFPGEELLESPPVDLGEGQDDDALPSGEEERHDGREEGVPEPDPVMNGGHQRQNRPGEERKTDLTGPLPP